MSREESRPEWGREIGTPVAVLSLEPDDLIARGAVSMFINGYDDLDKVRVAWLSDNVALVRHEGAPSPGTEVVISDFRPDRAAAASRELGNVLRALRLSEEHLTWTRPDLGTVPAKPRLLDRFRLLFRAATRRLPRSRTKSSPRHA
jgi:hypothetical protein